MGNTSSPLTRENLLQNVANELSEADCRRTGRLSRDTVFARSSSRFFWPAVGSLKGSDFIRGCSPYIFCIFLVHKKKKETTNEVS